jgi:8-oxo-dGTP pyrophosphatase MutT (NUDIX family)
MKEISSGGVVYRNQAGQLEIQMIQDRYGKITLAKGKMEPGETVEQTALREVWEETGIKGSIVEPIEIIKYQFSNANGELVDKEVHYYLIEAVSGNLQAQVEEIRGVEWLEPMDAWRQQKNAGYDNNDSVLRKGLEKLKVEVE